MKNLFLSFIFIFFTLLSPTFVNAHRARTESLMDGEMHINPDDDPIAGQDATLFFKLDDSTGKFISKNCECRVNIFKDGRLIFSKTIIPVTDPVSEIVEDFSLVYAFPTRGQYYIHLDADPKSQKDFDAFRLEFDVLVDRGEIIPTPTSTLSEQPSMRDSSKVMNGSVAAGAILIFLIAGVLAYIKHSSSKR